MEIEWREGSKEKGRGGTREEMGRGGRHGRNFGLKVGVPIQKENYAPFGPETSRE